MGDDALWLVEHGGPEKNKDTGSCFCIDSAPNPKEIPGTAEKSSNDRKTIFVRQNLTSLNYENLVTKLFFKESSTRLSEPAFVHTQLTPLVCR